MSRPTVTVVGGLADGRGEDRGHDAPVEEDGQALVVGHHEVAQEVEEDKGAVAVDAGLHQLGAGHQRLHQRQDVVP